ncbi:AAA family ATPase [Candidatus Acetothermia bacterium]|nr:AAA family ATPase [Candidatus Acetothermia bacterium]
MNPASIILAPEVLEEGHLPEVLVAREAQIEDARFCLALATNNWKPIHVWLHGRPGLGKTTVTRHLLNQLGNAGIKSVHVNCGERKSFYSVLDFIVAELRILKGSQRGSSYKLDILKDHAEKKPIVVALDEIHLMPIAERTDMLHALAPMGKLGLVCISPSRGTITSLEESTYSRLSPKLIEFARYSVDDVFKILWLRAQHAIAENAWSEDLLKMIAERAEGDARIAIQTLKRAAMLADRENDCIKPRHVETAFGRVKDLKRSYELKGMGEHHRLAYQIVSEKREVMTPELLDEYLRRCKVSGMRPVSRRSLGNYLKDISRKGWVKELPSGKQSGAHLYRIVD